MKVYVQIVDSKTGIYQCGMIDEPVQKGFEVANAIGHFGVSINDVNWVSEHSNSIDAKIGEVKETTKVVTVIILK